MRRVVTAGVTAALALSVAGYRVDALSPGKVRLSGSAAAMEAAARAAAARTRTIEFRGYVLKVAANWPVYRLSADPHRCVRFDVHAIYLGHPGPDQQCPAHVVGHTDALWIDDAGSAGRAAAVPGAPLAPSIARGGPAARKGVASAGRTAAAARGSAIATVMDDAADGEVRASVPAPGLSVTATYASDPATVERIIQSIRQAPDPARPSPRKARAKAPGRAANRAGRTRSRNAPARAAHKAGRSAGGTRPPRAAGKAVRGATRGRPATAAGKAERPADPGALSAPGGDPTVSADPSAPADPGAPSDPGGDAAVPAVAVPAVAVPAVAVPAVAAVPVVAAVPADAASHPAATKGQPSVRAAARAASHRRTPSKPRVRTRATRAFPSGPTAGFDSCTAPSKAALRAWKGRASVVAVYIGGADRACANGNLSASWVHEVRAAGWHLIPTYVGLQASCDHFGGRINPQNAASEGRAAADDAMTEAGSLGIRRGAPLYYDMEDYNTHNGTCRTGVLTFLDAWTRELHTRGYVSGVYSSARSGVRDLAGTNSIGGHALAKPDSIWIGFWDRNSNLSALPYVPASAWTGRRRIKQYQGSHWETHGKVRLNIDSDCVYGAVYLRSAYASARYNYDARWRRHVQSLIRFA